MKNKLFLKLISLVLVIITLATALPLNVIAEALEGEEKVELYIKSVKLAQAKTKEEAKSILEDEGYIAPVERSGYFVCHIDVMSNNCSKSEKAPLAHTIKQE